MTAQDFPIRRNSVLLAAGLAASGGMMQVAVAVGTTTLVLVTGVKSIVGLGPAIFLSTAALAALPAGRAMDRYGRMPVIAGGFATGIVATATVALGCLWVSTPLVVLGLALVGASSGTVILARAAAADMYPAERRARGISLVLFGAVFGAALGPLVFKPLFAGEHTVDTDSLVLPWFVASAIMAVGLAIALSVRPDPKQIGEALGYGSGGGDGDRARPRRSPTILRRPGVVPALIAAVASFSVMVSVMTLSGYVVVGHGHSTGDTFWVISVHIVGMYGLVLVVGDVIDRVGQAPGARRRARDHGRLDDLHGVDRERRRHEPVALRARSRLVALVRRRDVGARRPRGAGGARPPRRLLRPAVGLHGRCPRHPRRDRVQRHRRGSGRRRRDARRGATRARSSCSPAAGRRASRPSSPPASRVTSARNSS